MRRALVALVALLATMPTGAALAEPAGAPAGDGNTGGFLDLGPAHGCAIQRDRTVRCWGRGASGALGSGGTDDALDRPGTTASTVPGLGPAVQVAVGDLSTCALLRGSVVRCWGQGSSGQLGSGERDNRLDGWVDPRTGTDAPSTVLAGEPVVQLTAGGSFACALMATGTVRCWGGGLFGRTGGRDTSDRLDGLPDAGGDAATTVPLPGAATAISAGDLHACALLTDGSVHCWGAGADGRLGSGATDDRLDGEVDPATGTDEASTVPLDGAATAISAGGAHTCALMASGEVRCWGLGTSGQLGSGSSSGSRLDAPGEVPTTVPLKPIGTTAAQAPKVPNLRATAIAAGDFHTCAIVEGGDVRCWGAGEHGQLGQGATDGRLDQSATNPADAATRVGGGPTGTGPGLGAAAVAVTAGSAATCAVLATGAVRCWGSGEGGRLGSSGTDARLDGVVDPGAPGDDASLVPIGALPLNAGDGLPVPVGVLTPTPGPAAASLAPPATPQSSTTVPPRLSAAITVRRRTLRLRALAALKVAGSHCPSRMRVRVRIGKRTIGTGRLKAAAKGAACRVSGTVRLRTAVRRKRVVSIRLTGPGLVSRNLTARAR